MGGVDINWRAEEAKTLAKHGTFKIMETSLNDSQLTQERQEAEKLVAEAVADFKAFLEGLWGKCYIQVGMLFVYHSNLSLS